MIYVVGDIHSEISKLLLLVDFICKKDKSPTFVFIGDYIDKGEDAKKTLDYLLYVKNNFPCIYLKGNHEYAWQNAIDYEEYLLKFGALNTIKSFKCSGVLDTQILLLEQYGEIFDSMVNYYKIQNYFICHSGIAPDVYQRPDLDNRNTKEFLFNRYDFIKETRLFEDYYTVIFGHTGFYSPYYDGYKIGIDTAACYLPSQPISAYCVEKSYFINSDKEIFYLKDISRSLCPNILRNEPWRKIC
jgi:serine/threonine protein phosphatase 1